MSDTLTIVTELAKSQGTQSCPASGRVLITSEGVIATGEIVCYSSGSHVMVKLDGTGQSVFIPTELVTQETTS